jgi:hypothetical protein
MGSIAWESVISKLPVAQLEATLEDFVRPLAQRLPDKRWRRTVRLVIRQMIAAQTPVITAMMRTANREKGKVWALAKRAYRLLSTRRFTTWQLTKGLYRRAQATVAAENVPYLVVAVDPVNFEKPYTEQAEGVCTVRKSTPPALNGEARLTKGYSAITATVVNTRVPATTYARWFSYQSKDFVSQPREIYRALRMTRALFPHHRLRFVMDGEGDDQKVFQWVEQMGAEFVIRAVHLDRQVEVWNDRLQRWEEEHLQDLVDTICPQETWEVRFHHAGRVRWATVRVGWLQIRLPGSLTCLWMIVVEEPDIERTTVLLTNVPVTDGQVARALYSDWRLRGRIEHGYRFDQEQGLDVEDMRVRTLERMQRLFILLLAAAQFVFHIAAHWPPEAVAWLRRLGGKLDRASDRDGPYLLLRGLSAVWQTVATLSWAKLQPFPHRLFADHGSYG